ncbi:hypothetical protein [Paucilactobacillus wasatchensis]|uniref:Uncharacterized protein n=1 Tax=Paucilactobacillus wasatchensis TaxID=1335616 RepID=A0A0D1A841_9LACO|nr:hypothetical protein [Paucilactobacillus wasatchensis]KIS03887.1 hypothetical protein WDC_0534 [Paucilactobacillus wasatchensis]
MIDVFTMLKMMNVDHRHVANSQIVITDEEGKPDALLTDLLRDVVSSINIFIDIRDVYSVDDLIDAFSAHTPLPDDVLDEYSKILKQTILGLNFATRKNQIELIFGGTN